MKTMIDLGLVEDDTNGNANTMMNVATEMAKGDIDDRTGITMIQNRPVVMRRGGRGGGGIMTVIVMRLRKRGKRGDVEDVSERIDIAREIEIGHASLIDLTLEIGMTTETENENGIEVRSTENATGIARTSK